MAIQSKNELLPKEAAPGNINYQRWLFGAGFLVLLAYTAVSLLIEPAESYISSLLLLLGFGGFFWMGHQLRVSPPMWMFVAAIAIALLSWMLAHAHHPEWAENSPKVHRLTIWLQFIAVAWLLGGSTRRTLILWGTFALSLLFVPWVTGNGIEEWISGLQGKRIDFGIHNAQHTALLYAIAFMGMIAFSHRFLKPGKAHTLRIVLWATGLTIYGAATVITQTRGVWLGCLAAAAVFAAAFIVWMVRISPSSAEKRRLTGALVVAIGVASLAAISLNEIVEARINAESNIIDKLLSDEPYDGKSSSINYRIASWSAALPWIKERPIIGWGGNGRKLVLDHSEQLPSWIQSRTGHLHSSYMDILVNFGLLGLGLFLTILIWTTVSGVKAWKHGHLPGDILVFYLAFIAFWLVVNTFESFMFYSTGQYIFGLMLGGIVTHIWRAQLETSREKDNTLLAIK